MKKIILILDKLEYKEKEELIKQSLTDSKELKIYYTLYEDALIRMVCKWKYVGELLLHILYWIKSFNYALIIYFSNSRGRIVCINPIVGIFLGCLNRNKKFEIIIGGFLFEPKKNILYYNIRKKVVSYFLRGINKVVVYSNREVKYYEELFGIKKFNFVKYGIDYNAHKSYDNDLPSKFIFSGGRSNRDYHTLIQAYDKYIKEHSDIELCIATRPVILQDENTKNIKILKDVVLENFGDVLERAEFVVIPLIDTDISAGHQVLLEALERNKIIIISKISAVLDYVTEDQVIFYKPNDINDLCDKMSYVTQNIEVLKKKYANNSRFYKENYNFIEFISRMINTL